VLIILLLGGSGDGCGILGNGCDNNIIWIILILILFGGYGNFGMCESK